MLFNLVTILFVNILLYTLGRFLFDLSKKTNSLNPFFFSYIGLAFIGFFSMFTSFFFSINKFNIIFYVFFSFLAILKYRKKVIPTRNIEFILVWFFALLVISWLLGYRTYPYNTDTDYYHANAVKWLSQYGTVIGLANLNQRLGGNSSWHVIAAVFDCFSLKDRTSWVMPLISYSLSFGFFSWEYFHKKNIWQKIFSLFAIGWAIINAITWGFPSLHYDFTPLFINLIVVYLFLESYLNNSEFNLFHMIILATSSFMIKPMGAMTIIFLFIFTFMLIQAKKISLRQSILIWLIPLLCLLVWLTRNILLSGWLLFPTPKFQLNLDWTTPYSITFKTYADIWTWARVPIQGHEEVINWPFEKWFQYWIRINFNSLRFYVLAIFPFITGSLLWIKTFKKQQNYIFLFFWKLSSLIFWFLMAPDIRFGDGFFLVFLLVPLSIYLSSIKNFVNSTILKIIPLGMFTILLLATFYLNMTGKRGPLNLLSIGIHLPGPIQLAPIIENNQVILKIWKPIQLNKCIPNNPNFICPQNVDLYKELSDCSNSPLPCTSYFNDNIRLRDGKNIENGFRLKE